MQNRAGDPPRARLVIGLLLATVSLATVSLTACGGEDDPGDGGWSDGSSPALEICDNGIDDDGDGGQVTRISVPAGTTIYEGAAAAQGGLVGGGSQVFILRVDPSWVMP